jgi:hypothetical protein
MNGIKKVFSQHRNSTSGDDVRDGSARDSYGRDSSAHDSSTDAMSPRSNQTGLSSAGNTSVDETESSGLTNSGPKVATRTGGVGNTSRGSTGNSGSATTGNKIASPNTSGPGTGPGRSEVVAATDGTMQHSHGQHLGNSDLTKGKVTQTVEHLGEVTRRTNHSHTIEEVERQRELERHSHHIQVHHQPIKHEEHAVEQVHQRSHPVTKISEKHASTDKDAKLLSTIATGHGYKDEVRVGAKDHTIVDQGEVVNESVHHHIHNVVVPLISHDAHEHHRIKTVIPTHHVLHEAPIIHESSTLEAISKDDFLKRGGILGSSHKDVGQANILTQGTCDRTVDGVGEKLAQELRLSSTTHGSTTT